MPSYQAIFLESLIETEFERFCKLGGEPYQNPVHWPTLSTGGFASFPLAVIGRDTIY